MSAEINNVFAGLDTRLRNFKKEFGMEFMDRVKAKTPVRTGTLQNSWGFTEKKTDIEIYNVAPYARYVEEGTEKMAPARMLALTMDESKQIAEVAAKRAKKK